MTGGLLEEQELDDIYAMFQVNLVGRRARSRAPCCPGCSSAAAGKIVNNASISGYAYFPATTTYAAAKAGVVAFSESLRRELKGTGRERAPPRHAGRGHGHGGRHPRGLRPPHGHERLGLQPAQEWAAKVVRAIEHDDHVLGPGGRLALAKLASRGPARAARTRLGARCSLASRGGRLGQQHLVVLDPSLAEPALGPGRVELPHPPEALVVAQPRSRSAAASEVLAPAPQRGRIARGDVLQLDDRMSVARGERSAGSPRSDGRQPAGKTSVVREAARAPSRPRRSGRRS